MLLDGKELRELVIASGYNRSVMVLTLLYFDLGILLVTTPFRDFLLRGLLAKNSVLELAVKSKPTSSLVHSRLVYNLTCLRSILDAGNA